MGNRVEIGAVVRRTFAAHTVFGSSCRLDLFLGFGRTDVRGFQRNKPHLVGHLALKFGKNTDVTAVFAVLAACKNTLETFKTIFGAVEFAVQLVNLFGNSVILCQFCLRRFFTFLFTDEQLVHSEAEENQAEQQNSRCRIEVRLAGVEFILIADRTGKQ